VTFRVIWKSISHSKPKIFTAMHNAKRLVWFERHDLIVDAIAREKAIKNGTADRR
jgi:predicted GIY-YIG superfamily endonuclease